jgi:release factor glutamine methyltransferase
MANPQTSSDSAPSYQALLEWGRTVLAARVESAALDAELLLAFAADVSRSRLRAWPERIAKPDQEQAYRSLIQRRACGEPVAYLLGQREFWSLCLDVSSDTLIPRPETECLVERALALLPADSEAAVLDLGTGAGGIALALATERPGIQLTALDRSPAALAVAQRNAARLGCRVMWLASDWFSALADRSFDLIVANPPYVADADPHLECGDLRFEPRAALAAGPDGLSALRAIITVAPRHLRPGGVLLLEHGFDQGPAVLGLLQHAGFRDCRDHQDLAGLPRVAEGHWPDNPLSS